MKNQLSKLDKALKITIIVGILIISLSVCYYLVFKPQQIQKNEFDSCYDQCDKDGFGVNCIPLCGRKYSN